MRLYLTSAIVGIFTSLSLAGLAFAQDISVPTGAVLLTVSGPISATNVNDSLQLDLAALMALDATEIATSTVWTDGIHTFTGVSLHVLARTLGVANGTLLATAINDYTVEIPLTDAVAGGPILAYLMDGKEMSVRDKGPLWVIYPYDSQAEYRSEVVYTRSIWQLDRIEVTE